ITSQMPGLAGWSDAIRFAEEHGGAMHRNGHKVLRFRRDGDTVHSIEADAEVIGFANGEAYVCGDSTEALVFGPDGEPTPKFGLNVSTMAEILRRSALPSASTGAAHLKWRPGIRLAAANLSFPFGVLAFVRQTVRREVSGAW